MWESFCLDSRYFRSRGCLELRSWTAWEIAGDIKEGIGECIRQDSLEKTVSWASFFWSGPIEGSLFFKTKFFFYLLLKPSLLFYKILFDFKLSNDLIRLWR